MARHRENNLQVHKTRVLGDFTSKLKLGLAVSGPSEIRGFSSFHRLCGLEFDPRGVLAPGASCSRCSSPSSGGLFSGESSASVGSGEEKVAFGTMTTASKFH